MPLFSLIMPVYNVETYVEAAIKSILQQTYSDFELIVVNDGTEDHSMTIVEKYAAEDNRVTIVNQNNRGLSAARNTGMEYANGDYICFVDSDDVIDSRYFEYTISLITKEKPDTLMFGMLIQKINKKDQVIYENWIAAEPGIYNRSNLNEFILCDDSIELMGYATNKIYKRSFLEAEKIKFNEDINFLEDIEFNKQVLASVESFVVSNKCAYIYKQRNQDSIIKTYHENHFELQMKGIDSRKSILENWDINHNLIEMSLARLHFRAIRGSCSNLFHNINELTFLEKRYIVNFMLHNPETISRINHFKANSLYEKVLKSIISRKYSWILSSISSIYSIKKRMLDDSKKNLARYEKVVRKKEREKNYEA